MKKKTRKPGGAVGIKTIEDTPELDSPADREGTNHDAASRATKPSRVPKVKTDRQSGDSVSVSDVRKAAAFVNQIGGLEKALAVLQILKVAKEVE